MAGGRGGVDQAAVGLHDRRLRDPLGVGALDEAPQVARQQRRERGVDLGRGGALVLAEGADDLVRERDVSVGQGVRERLAQRELVLGMAVGVQQHDGDRLDRGPQLASRLASQPAAEGSNGSSGPSGVIRSRAPKRSSAGTSGAGRAAHSR